MKSVSIAIPVVAGEGEDKVTLGEALAMARDRLVDSGDNELMELAQYFGKRGTVQVPIIYGEEVGQWRDRAIVNYDASPGVAVWTKTILMDREHYVFVGWVV